MWSKQADTRNKNMTSFKNKITNRKRKNAKQEEKSEAPAKKEEQTKPEGQKSNRNRARNRTKSTTDNNVEPTGNRHQGKCANGKDDISTKNLEAADVVLRNANNLVEKRTNTALKRYSDSYVFDTNAGNILDNVLGEEVLPKLTRAVSGFLYLESKSKSRFSDLFKSGAMKLSASTENLKNAGKKDKDLPKKQENNKSKASTKKAPDAATPISRNNSQRCNKAKKETPVIPTETSYLKRVKSKIYKSKSDDTCPPSKIPISEDKSSKSKKLKPKKSKEISGRIPEDEEAVISPPGIRKSLTHFDFRLMRQSSNLERRRSRIDEDKPTDENKNPSVPPSPKPLHFFGKAKSSSAINLNLLRNRKNKILDNSCTDVQSEFDFIAFGGLNGSLQKPRQFGSQTAISGHNRTPSWLNYYNKKNSETVDEVDSSAESNRTGQPVSRSGSDRRPDAVREERHQLESASGAGGDPMNDSLIATKEDCLTPESSEKTHVPKKKSTNVSRSESVKEQPEKRKQRRNYSDPSHNNTPSGDVDHDTPPQAGFSNPDSSSSSSTSICNGRLSESPSNSVDTVGTRLHNRTDSDSDTGFESDIPQWQALVPEEQRKNLDPQEQKRQDIINEIFATENSHVRNLRVLHKIFYEKLRSSQVLKTDELHLIFPNIRDLFEVHNEFNRQMRRQREQDKVLVREVGELLLRMFEGERGDRLKTEAARFCEKQKYALELIKEKRKKDTKLENVLAECEKKRHCRRLQLQGILPIEMQRLSKYPLLLMRLIENTDKARTEELANLEKALRLCKEVANHVDEAVKLATNRQRLEEIQRHLDISNITRNDHPAVREFNLSATDLTKYTLIMEGSMQLRRPNKANVPIHVLLMEEAVFLLQREGDRYLLKFFQSGFGSNTQPLSPHIKTSLLLVRPNAVCKNGLYLVNTHTSNCQIYDLISEDDAQLDTWFKHFSDVVDRNNLKDGGKPKAPPASDLDDGGGGGGGQPESVQELPPAADVRPERAEQVAHDDKSAPEEDDDQSAKREDDEKSDGEKSADESGPKAPERGGGVEQLPKVTAEEWPLIQPSQVQVEVPPVHTAESMLTPLEQIRRKDIEVRKALEDKEHLVADLLNIPREDFQHIADMASSDVAGPREPTERLLAAIYQMGQLQKLINESLNVTESDAIAARGGKNAACASQQVQQSSYKPLLPVESVQSIVTTISQQFNALMSDVKHLEDERDLFRKENAKLRERLHEQCNLHGPAAESPTEAESSDNADDLANMEESLQKNEDGEVVEQ